MRRTNRLPFALDSVAAIVIGVLLIVTPQNAAQLLIVLLGIFWGSQLSVAPWRSASLAGGALTAGAAVILMGEYGLLAAVQKGQVKR